MSRFYLPREAFLSHTTCWARVLPVSMSCYLLTRAGACVVCVLLWSANLGGVTFPPHTPITGRGVINYLINELTANCRSYPSEVNVLPTYFFTHVKDHTRKITTWERGGEMRETDLEEGEKENVLVNIYFYRL